MNVGNNDSICYADHDSNRKTHQIESTKKDALVNSEFVAESEVERFDEWFDVREL